MEAQLTRPGGFTLASMVSEPSSEAFNVVTAGQGGGCWSSSGIGRPGADGELAVKWEGREGGLSGCLCSLLRL